MDKIRRKFSLADGFVLSLITGVILATVVFNTVIGKDLGGAVFDGIEKEISDIAAIRGGAVFARSWKLVSAQGFDPFFFLALLLPGFARSIIMAGYFLKFGLASGVMYMFLDKHTRIAPVYAYVLGILYAFSSQVMFTAQFNTVMNLAVFMPLFMCCADSYLRERSHVSFIRLSVSSALVTVCYLPGLLAGIPFMFVSTLLMCIALYSGFTKCMKSFLSSIPPVLLGIVLSNFALMPVLGDYEISFTFKEAYESARMNYKLYDILCNMFAFSSGSLSNINPPVFYIGLLTAVLFVLFLLNRKIPFRLKTAVLITGVLMYASLASSFVRWLSLPYGINPVITASRLIGFTAVIMFCCGISVKNIKDVPEGLIYASGLIPCAFVVLAGGAQSEVKRLPLILIGTIAGLIGWMLFLKAFNDHKIGRAGLTVFLALAVSFIGFNAFKIISANTISHDFTKSPFGETEEGDDRGIIYDEDGVDISVFTKNDETRYLILSSDMSQMTGSYIDMINAASRASLGGDVFENTDLRMVFAQNLTSQGPGIYTVTPGFNQIVFNCDIEDDGDYYLCSSFHCPVTIEQVSKTFDMEDIYDGPFLHKIDNVAASYGITLDLNVNEAETQTISLGKLIPEALDDLNLRTRTVNSSGIEFTFDDIPGRSGGIKMIIFNIPYESDLSVSVNGRKCDKTSYAGLLAVTFPASSDRTVYKVDIDKNVTGLASGVCISVLGLVMLLAIGVVNKYNNSTKENNTEVMTDAQQEDN